MPFAEVSVNSPIAQRRAFSYSIPSDLKVKVGQAVWVPFGAKTLQGIVLELVEYPSVEETREIAGVIDSEPLLSPAHVSLAQWISLHYLSSLFASIALMLPPGFERRVKTYISRTPGIVEIPACSDDYQKQIIETGFSKGKSKLERP